MTHTSSAQTKSSPRPTKTDAAKPSGVKKDGLAARALNAALRKVTKNLSKADRQAAHQRVENLRRKNPKLDQDALVDMLIARKARRAGAIGAVTSAPATIPGVGTMASLILGSTVDLSMTMTLQAELVLEIAYAYDVEMSPREEGGSILLVAGFGVGANHVAKRAGALIAAKAGEQFAKKSLARALPVISMGAAAGNNMATTYLVGRRAKAWFAQGDARPDTPGDAVRSLTGLSSNKVKPVSP